MEAAGIPLLGALAAISPDGRSLTLLVINRALAAKLTASIHLTDYTPLATAQVLGVTGPGISAHNEDQAKAVTLTPAQINDAASQFLYTFPPHSLTMFQFQAASQN